MFDTVLHRWFRIPYTLNVRHLQRPKKPRATLLFLHGLGNTAGAWNQVIERMPDDIRIISVDMLGFGESPSPTWAVYNAKTQARAVLATLLKKRIATPLIIVGHSMGALVAVEAAKRYPLAIHRLILCSPPFYNVSDKTKRLLPSNDRALQKIYKLAKNNPDQFLQLSNFAMKYGLINESFNVTKDNIDSYMAALEAIIINQTSYEDAMQLKVPTTILRGTLDPFVVSKNIRAINKANPNISTKMVIAGHEIKGAFVSAVVKAIRQYLPPQRTPRVRKK